ncbi:hypothetical protein CEXT_680221 [Caerostris extrusa]|uniref:Uncharacterized protein n=1 Tax=Caerostris extrusa TaxID=172846 RepID=A0AAV4XKR0_CAEEX|nr:hypothetical protein CEXT_680221 [Caerostris extrusa]
MFGDRPWPDCIYGGEDNPHAQYSNVLPNDFSAMESCIEDYHRFPIPNNPGISGSVPPVTSNSLEITDCQVGPYTSSVNYSGLFAEHFSKFPNAAEDISGTSIVSGRQQKSPDVSIAQASETCGNFQPNRKG